MPTLTRPNAAKRSGSGRAGAYLESEYRRAREHQALVRRDRLAHVLPRSLAKSVPVALVICLVLAFGVDLPGGFAFLVFALIVVVWSAVVIVAAFGGDGELEALRDSAEAERKTARVAARLRRYGWTVLHDMEIPSADAVVGHLLIGPGGILVITSNPSKGTVRFTKKVVSVNGEPLTPIIERTAFLAAQVKADLQPLVPLVKLPVHPVLVMVEADVLWKDGAVDGVTIIDLRALVDFARGRAGKLNPVEAKKVVTAAKATFPPFVDNRDLDKVTIGRDQWVVLMDLLHAIRERDGDASDLLDRLTHVEAQLSRQADGTSRPGIDGATADDEMDSADDSGPGTGPSAVRPAPRAVGLRVAPDGSAPDERGSGIRPLGRARGRRPRAAGGSRPSLAAVRPETDTPAPRVPDDDVGDADA